MIKVYVSRFNKEKDDAPHLECYEIEKTRQMTVLDALKDINNKYNEDISFRSSCRAGQCGSCGIKFKGNGALACKKEIRDGAIIEPLDLPVIKDLIVDKSEIENKVKDLHLCLNSDENELNTALKSSTLKDTKNVRSCIECYSCLSTCPVVKHFKKEFSGPYFMRYLSKFEFDPRNEENRLNDVLKEGLYNCTSCGKCGSVCPKNINIYGNGIEKLREIVFNENLGPLPEHAEIKKSIEKTGRSIKQNGIGFVEAINKIREKSENKVKVALFTGCMVDYKLQNIAYALMDIFEANGIEIDIPEGQVCCGSPLIRTGQTDIVEDLVNKNKEIFKDYDIVVTICAGCGATLKNDHPKYGSSLNVMDISEFLIDKLDSSKMNDLDMTVTWHDPCHLSRGQNIKDEPRELIEKIKGVKLVEMKYPCQCCGAGGGVKSARPEIALKLSKDKAKMIKDTEAEAVITICPFCQYNLQDGLDSENLSNIKAMNILELLKMAYEK
jgi:fumarate reductase (CoM/CoB) subunit B